MARQLEERAYYAERLPDGTRRTVHGKVAACDANSNLMRITEEEARAISAAVRVRDVQHSKPTRDLAAEIDELKAEVARLKNDK